MRSPVISGARSYERCSDLGLVTCYFNPEGYQTKLANYERFAEKIDASGLYLLTVQCAFGDEAFALKPSVKTVQLRSNCILWQKERLLNIAVSHLPDSITKVAWLDCDVLFTNPSWAVETSALLDSFPIVQPFADLFRLPRGSIAYDGEGERYPSFGYIWNTKPDPTFRGMFYRHGHTGLAWAAQRSLLRKHGLYDACISGSGDHLMAHAMCGDFRSSCVEHLTGNYSSDVQLFARRLKNFLPRLSRLITSQGANAPASVAVSMSKLFSHFVQWGQPLFQDVQGQVRHVPGTLLHLWHGETANRMYWQRHKEMIKCKFDPYVDIQINTNGTWKWSSDNYQLQHWAKEYFTHRKEDG